MSEERVTLSVVIALDVDPRWREQKLDGILSDLAWSVASNQAWVVSAARVCPDGGTEPLSVEGRGPQPGWGDPPGEVDP